MILLSFNGSGAEPDAIWRARPSTTAVLPTPGSPIKTGLDFVLRHSTCITRLISFSRPITGSNSPSKAICVKSVPKLSRVGVLILLLRFEVLGRSDFEFKSDFLVVFWECVLVSLPKISLTCLRTARGVNPIVKNCWTIKPESSAKIPNKICSVST